MEAGKGGRGWPSLRVAVCIKQIPLVGKVGFNPTTRRIERTGPSVINAFDLRALALAVSLKARLSCTTVAVTMGPPQARQALEDALAMGIDLAIHLEDVGFAGADTLATARALADVLRPRRFDLILAGKYSLDADTGQVGPQLAELLGVAHVSAVQRFELVGREVHAERESDEGYDEVRCRLPAVLTCAERLIKPIRVALERRAGTGAGSLETVRIADLGQPADRYGALGSQTVVGAIRSVAPRRREGRRIAGRNPRRVVEAMVARIAAWEILDDAAAESTPVSPMRRRPTRGRDVFVACETRLDGSLTSTSFELLAAAGSLAEQAGGAVVAVVTGPIAPPDQNLLAGYGADRILQIELPRDGARAPDRIAAAFAEVVEEHSPWALLVPATAHGRDWAPRLAARLGAGLTGDAVALEIDPARDRLVALKAAFGGAVLGEVHSRGLPQMVTVRPGMLPLGRPAEGRWADLIEARPTPGRPLVELVRSQRLVDEETAILEHARVVIGVGMGLVGVPDGLPAARRLARLLGGSLCATRRVADGGWLPRQTQVGLTGKGLNARLYIGLGVSGSFNHTVGLARVERVVAVNQDPAAPFFDSVDLAVVQEVAPVLTELIAAFERSPSRAHA